MSKREADKDYYRKNRDRILSRMRAKYHATPRPPILKACCICGEPFRVWGRSERCTRQRCIKEKRRQNWRKYYFSESGKAYREANRLKILERQRRWARKWRPLHLDLARARSRADYWKNPEKHRERSLKYVQQNKEKVRVANRAWWRRQREIVKAARELGLI